MSDHAAPAVVAALDRRPHELDDLLRGRRAPSLRIRPAERAWSATEILCHLRDVEELFQVRFQTILALDEPRILVFGASATDLAPWRIRSHDEHPLNPDRWAEDRQYARSDPHEALASFSRRRRSVVTMLTALGESEWARRGIHLSQGPLSLLEWVARLAAHDANHAEQLVRALDGRA